jgi:hypothetical protein
MKKEYKPPAKNDRPRPKVLETGIDIMKFLNDQSALDVDEEMSKQQLSDLYSNEWQKLMKNHEQELEAKKNEMAMMQNDFQNELDRVTTQKIDGTAEPLFNLQAMNNTLSPLLNQSSAQNRYNIVLGDQEQEDAEVDSQMQIMGEDNQQTDINQELMQHYENLAVQHNAQADAHGL